MRATSKVLLGIIFTSCLQANEPYRVNVVRTSGAFTGEAYLYDVNGLYMGISTGVLEAEPIDSDSDEVVDYYTMQLQFAVPPGSYSISLSTDISNGFSPLLAFPQADYSEMNLSVFNLGAAPIGPDQGDINVMGNLDVFGNIMNFGTIAPDEYNSFKPGVRFLINPVENSFETYMPAQLNYAESGPASMMWAFGYEWSGQQQTRMTFDASGKLLIQSQSGSLAGISVDGYGVITAKPGANQLQSLRIGNVTGSTTGSLAFGSGTNAQGNYSLAGGIGNTASSYAMTALGHYSATSSGSVSQWVGTDDLFVIGNGSSATSRSNAVRIRKNGAIGFGNGALSGLPGGGLGGLDIAYGGSPATLILGAQENLTSRGHNTPKIARVAVPHYSNQQNGVAAFVIATGNSANTVSIGGGANTLHASTGIEFWTAPTTTTLTGVKRFSISGQGAISAGENTVATGTAQMVVGKYNNTNSDTTGNHAEGLFIVGNGSGTGLTPRKNAMRILESGTILIQPAGDIPMTGYEEGEQP